jgi:hypothetical protein
MLSGIEEDHIVAVQQAWIALDAGAVKKMSFKSG